MSSINFDNPYLLLIAIPLVALFAIPFALAIRKKNVNGHNVTSMVLHVVIALIIAFIAAGTSIRTVITETEVYVVADVSYSANKNLDEVDNYIKNIELPKNAKLGVVCFGKDYELLYPLAEQKDVGSVKENNIDDSESNIAEAMEYAGTLYSDNVIKRMVLITDGKQTDTRDTYAIKRAVSGLNAQNVRVDAIFLDDTIKEDAKEVQISDVTVTQDTYLGHEENAVINVQSSFETQAFLVLYSGETKLKERAVTLTTGSNSFNFGLDTSKAGNFNYEVRIEAEEDENPYNNKFAFTQNVEGNIRILFITKDWVNVLAAVERYGDAAELDIYENDKTVDYYDKEDYMATLPNNIHIHREELEVPFTVEEMSVFDEFILCDVDITTLKNTTLFVTSLDNVVSKFGKTLVTYGDLGIQGKEEQDLRKLEDMLPVRFRNDDTAPRLFTLVIDASRSMEQNYHMINAKIAAAELVKLLKPGDNVCVITFAGDVRTVVTPKPVGDGNAVIEEIEGIDNMQGTYIGLGLQTAYDRIKALDYSDKQVMLITDGLSYTNEEDNPITIAENMYGDGIVTSVLDMARQGENANGVSQSATAQEAKQMLETVAANGHGNYYYWSNQTQDSGEIPSLLFGQLAGTITETVIDGRQTQVSVARRVDGVLDGVDRTAIPDVWGYLYSYNKASATSVLTVNHNKGSKITQQPLYSYWDYGLGKVATFTSSFAGEWLKDWQENGDAQKFFDNMLETNIPAHKAAFPYTVDVARNGNYAHIELVPAGARLSAYAIAEITMPDGTIEQATMAFDADRYYYEFDTSALGSYSIRLIYSYNNMSYASRTTFNISYTDEYNSFAAYETNVLHNAIDETGVVKTDGKLEIVNDERELGTYTNDLTVPLLIASVVIFVVDIVIRKLKWEDVVSFFGLKNKKDKKGGVTN